MGATDNPEPEYAIDTPYEYPVLPGTQEWIDLGDTLTRRRACQIPDDILHNMTTDALLQTVINYPFLPDIYAFDSIQMGYETVKRRFNGLQELETRPDYLDLLSCYCLENCSLDVGEKTLQDYMAEDIYLLLFDDSDSSTSAYASCRIKYVNTPKGSAVPTVEGRNFDVKCLDI